MLLVFGSINMNITMPVSSLPDGPVNMLTHDYDMVPGGKGANQALAAARCGVKTALVGKVGDDAMGHRILNRLRRYEVMTSGVARSENALTGLSMVVRSDGNDRQVITALGANMQARGEQVPDEALHSKNMVLLQSEFKTDENIDVMERAKEGGAKVVFNLSPSVELSKKAMSLIDLLIVNHTEVKKLGQALGIDPEKSADKIASALAKQGELDCVLTLGAKGAIAVTAQDEIWTVRALKVENVQETIGAGDCFCGTMAASLYANMPFQEALKRASVAASLSCKKEGGQASYPYRSEVDEFIDSVPSPERKT